MKQEKRNTCFNSLIRCLSRIIKEGYSENFIMTNNGLLSERNGKYYDPYETKILSRFSFENFDKKELNSVLYIIETTDGLRGTWVEMKNKL